MGHVTTPELSRIGKQGLTLRSTWRRQSPPVPGGKSDAVGHVVTSEPSRAERRGLMSWDT
jgi:hypothetical protein